MRLGLNGVRWTVAGEFYRVIAVILNEEGSRLSRVQLADSDDDDSVNRARAKTGCTTSVPGWRIPYSERHIRHHGRSSSTFLRFSRKLFSLSLSFSFSLPFSFSLLPPSLTFVTDSLSFSSSPPTFLLSLLFFFFFYLVRRSFVGFFLSCLLIAHFTILSFSLLIFSYFLLSLILPLFRFLPCSPRPNSTFSLLSSFIAPSHSFQNRNF